MVVSDVRPQVEETIAGIKEKHPDNKGHARITDVSDENQVKELVQAAVEKLGRLDIMVNNAGLHLKEGPVATMEKETIDKIFAVNFYGEFYGCKYAAQQMMKQKSGSIVNLGSYGGKVGFPEYSAYCSSKGAVHTMTTSLARELAPYNINVNAICPGLAASEMHWSFMKAEAKDRGITFDELKEEEFRTIPARTIWRRARFGGCYSLAGVRIGFVCHGTTHQCERRALLCVGGAENYKIKQN